MITNHRMGLKIWRIQRIKIPGIIESKRKPLDHKAWQRVGITTQTRKTPYLQGIWELCNAKLATFWQQYNIHKRLRAIRHYEQVR